jgi:hypothetical protein
MVLVSGLKMKPMENFYIFIGWRQLEYALKYLELSTTKNNSRVLHKNICRNTTFMNNNKTLPVLPQSSSYSTVQQVTMDGTNGTLVRKRSTGKSIGPVLESKRKKYGVRNTKRGNSVTQRLITDMVYDDNTIKMGNISAPIIQEDISAMQEDISVIQEDVSAIEENILARKKKKVTVKIMDINEAHHNMGCIGEARLRNFLNHHNIKATGKFPNGISCMKWKGQNKAVSKVSTNTAKYPGQRLHIDVSGPLPLQMGRKNNG